MPADTTTSIFAILLQGTGNNANSWGTNANNNFQIIENAIAGVTTYSGLTGGAVNLNTSDHHIYATVKLTGTLSSDLVITAPATANKWTFINELVTAGFYVLIKVAGQTAVNIPHGKITNITCDGTNMYRHDRENVGELFYHAGTTAPGGAIECAGAAPLRASAIDLFAEIGTTWGVGNGSTTFTLPDSYSSGRFLRSRSASVAVGAYQNGQNQSHSHTGSGTTGGVSADHSHAFAGSTGAMSQNASHTHGHNAQTGPSATGGGSFACSAASAATINAANIDHLHSYSGSTGGISQDHTHTYSFTTSTGSADGSEARPINMTALLCIRY